MQGGQHDGVHDDVDGVHGVHDDVGKEEEVGVKAMKGSTVNVKEDNMVNAMEEITVSVDKSMCGDDNDDTGTARPDHVDVEMTIEVCVNC